MDASLWKGRSVLVTGHTGFKGSWLALWLTELGARLTGFALAPESPNHWDLLDLDMVDSRGDIRDFGCLAEAFESSEPEVVFHLAAQSLVHRSYREPLETWSTNVQGTAHVLECCRRTPSVRVIVVVTTDKVYANQGWPWGYRENDRLGGHDPYSASKAASELLTGSYREAFLCGDGAPLLASARAGNVIGGGDWAENRLIPDLVRALGRSERLEIRSPKATRPWQHVLECLKGYLLLAEALMSGKREHAEAWNFGPDPDDNITVSQILTRLKSHWPDLDWNLTEKPQPHEATLLYLENAKAKAKLGWRPVWNLERGLRATAEWYRHFHETGVSITRRQLAEYHADARIHESGRTGK